MEGYRNARTPGFKLVLAIVVGFVLTIPLFSIYLRPGARRDKPIMATREVVSGFDCTAETPV